MSSSSDEELFLLENVELKIRRRKVGIHAINRGRGRFGEYHHLFPQVKLDKVRFFSYMRMELTTFSYILKKIEGVLVKFWGNWHKQPIHAEERLVICLR